MLPALPLLVGATAVLRGRGPGWLRGIGWVALWSAPAVLTQVVLAASSGGLLTGEALWTLPVVMLISWWVLAGGWVCVAFFESSLAAGEVPRQMTMVDNGAYFLGLVALWVGVLAFVLAEMVFVRPAEADDAAASPGTGEDPRDALGVSPRRVAWVVGAGVLVNALAASAWPWWGS